MIRYFLQPLSAVALFCGGQVSRDSHRIKEVQYADLFSPPSHYLPYRDAGVSRSLIDASTVKEATLDARRSGDDIELFKVVADSKRPVHHYIFYIKHHDDLFWVYTISVEHKRILHKFKFSPN